MSVDSGDRVVRRWEDVREGDVEPHLVLEPLTRALDQAGLGRGPLAVSPLGDGLSNVTYQVVRGDMTMVLRRAPSRDAVSSHDVIREARFVGPLLQHGVPVPEVLLVVEDPAIIGVPFVVFEYVDGVVVTEDLPPGWTSEAVGSPLMEALVDSLVQLHRVPWRQLGLGRESRARTFLDRQLDLFERLRAEPGQRSIDDLDEVARWLRSHRPPTGRLAIVHGDFRLGNVMFSRTAVPDVRAILDWEVVAVGDPLADLGYLVAMYPAEGDDQGLMLQMAAAARLPGFPSRGDLVARYSGQVGADVGDHLGWYMAMALWRTAVGLESLYARARRSGAHHPWIYEFETEVPLLARRALRVIHGDPALAIT